MHNACLAPTVLSLLHKYKQVKRNLDTALDKMLQFRMCGSNPHKYANIFKILT